MTDQTPKPCLPGCEWVMPESRLTHVVDCPHTPFECDTCGLKSDDLAIVAALRAEVERLRDVVIDASCISRLDQVYQVCVCGAGEPCREALAIIAARQKEESK